jgi:hypothetical protein
MNWATGLSWLAALKPPHGPTSDEADPADMGTAFGLDASFGPVDAAAPGAEPDTPSAPRVPWEHRLTRRSCL